MKQYLSAQPKLSSGSPLWRSLVPVRSQLQPQREEGRERSPAMDQERPAIPQPGHSFANLALTSSGAALPNGLPNERPISWVQPKLTIGAPNNRYEQGADLVAKQVVQRFYKPTVGRSPLPPSPLSLHPVTETQSAMVVNRGIQAQGNRIDQNENPSVKQRPNQTGLPDGLKLSIESLSSMSLDSVKVHYNSYQPAQLNALAYAHGSTIHLAPGQEQHLPHEAWHVVQQAQGRVKATKQLKNGVSINNDDSLEREADVMGTAALADAAQSQDSVKVRETQGMVTAGQPTGLKVRMHSTMSCPGLPAPLGPKPASFHRSGEVVQRITLRRFKIKDTQSIEELIPDFIGQNVFETSSLSLEVLGQLIERLNSDTKFQKEGDLVKLRQELKDRQSGGAKDDKTEKEPLKKTGTVLRPLEPAKPEKEPPKKTGTVLRPPEPAKAEKEVPKKTGKVLRLPEPDEEEKTKRSKRYDEYVDHLAQSYDEFAGKSLAEVLGNMDMHAFDSVDFKGMALACQKRATRKQMVEGCIEQLYSGIPWEGRVAITVYTDERQGKGDLVLGMKTVQLLREAFPKAKPDDIALMMDQTTMRSSVDPVALAKGFNIDPVTMPYGRGGKLTDTRGKGPQTFIRAPLLSSESQLETATGFKSFAPPKSTQHIAFTEYAKSEPGATPTGLKPSELGIMVHQDLRGYKQELATKEGPEAAQKWKLDHLLKLDDKRLVKAILTNPNASSSELAKIINTETPTAEEIQAFTTRRAKLYFGYSNRSGVKFAKTVAELERGNVQDIDVVHPGAENMQTQLPGFKKELDGAYQANLIEAGIDRVELIEFNAMQDKNPDTKTAKEPKIVVLQKKEKPKTMRLIYLPGVSPSDMINLFKASEKTVQTTGNQSTSEALSAGKNVLYECLAFKQNQQFMEDFHKMGEGVEGEGVEGGKDMMKLHKAQREADKDILTADKETVDAEAYKNVAELLRGGKMDKGFDKLSDLACTAKDFRSRLVGTYKRQMLMQYEEAKLLVKLEEKIHGDPSQENFENLSKAIISLKPGV